MSFDKVAYQKQYRKTANGKAADKRYRRSERCLEQKRRHGSSPLGRDTNHKYRLAIKCETLKHYGKGGRMLCCWRGCTVSDPDMLTLDHINNDGAQYRRENGGSGAASGCNLYAKLRSAGFPDNLFLQTLCCNHQSKKRIFDLRRQYVGREQVSGVRAIQHI